MLDHTFVEKVAGLGQQAARKPFVEAPGEDAKYVWVWDEKSQAYAPQIKRTHRRHAIASVLSLADFAKANGDSAGAFWYSRAGVILTFTDDADELAKDVDADRASLTLKASKPMDQLASWSSGRHPLKQDVAVRLLKTVFRDGVDPGGLVDAVAAIAWAVNENGKSVIAQGSRSVGRALEAKIENRQNLPDLVSFTVPVWETSDPDLRRVTVKVPCVLEADPQDQTFAFLPLAGAVEAAWAAAEADLEGQLGMQVDRAFGGTEIRPPIYHGVPSAT